MLFCQEKITSLVWKQVKKNCVEKTSLQHSCLESDINHLILYTGFKLCYSIHFSGVNAKTKVKFAYADKQGRKNAFLKYFKIPEKGLEVRVLQGNMWKASQLESSPFIKFSNALHF